MVINTKKSEGARASEKNVQMGYRRRVFEILEDEEKHLM